MHNKVILLEGVLIIYSKENIFRKMVFSVRSDWSFSVRSDWLVFKGGFGVCF